MRLEVIQAYSRVYQNPIAFSAGDQVQVGKPDPDNPEWVWCVGGDGREGWVHQSFLEVNGSGVAGTRDYNAIELSVSPGEQLEGFEVAAGWQWCRNAQGDAGWVPLECLKGPS
jgi:SH3-like domain-containing protein